MSINLNYADISSYIDFGRRTTAWNKHFICFKLSPTPLLDSLFSPDSIPVVLLFLMQTLEHFCVSSLKRLLSYIMYSAILTSSIPFFTPWAQWLLVLLSQMRLKICFVILLLSILIVRQKTLNLFFYLRLTSFRFLHSRRNVHSYYVSKLFFISF